MASSPLSTPLALVRSLDPEYASQCLRSTVEVEEIDINTFAVDEWPRRSDLLVFTGCRIAQLVDMGEY